MQIETKVRDLEIKLRARISAARSPRPRPAYVVTRINPNASISRIWRKVVCERARRRLTVYWTMERVERARTSRADSRRAIVFPDH